MNGYRIYGVRDDNHPPEPPDGSIRLSPLAAPQGVSRARHLPDCETCILFAPCMDAQRRNYEAHELRYPFARETCEATARGNKRETEDGPTEMQRLVIEKLRELQPCGASEVFKALPLSDIMVRRYLNQLCMDGVAEIVGEEIRHGKPTRIYRLKE